MRVCLLIKFVFLSARKKFDMYFLRALISDKPLGASNINEILPSQKAHKWIIVEEFLNSNRRNRSGARTEARNMKTRCILAR